MLGFKTYVIYGTIKVKNISFPIYLGRLFDCDKNWINRTRFNSFCRGFRGFNGYAGLLHVARTE